MDEDYRYKIAVAQIKSAFISRLEKAWVVIKKLLKLN